ncbi:hypothetical protein HDU67_005796 [Dinochytrium kinnereticum]|nr:hypothetical protein HDU67_005796 [Dinochytrium kinnereticum]
MTPKPQQDADDVMTSLLPPTVSTSVAPEPPVVTTTEAQVRPSVTASTADPRPPVVNPTVPPVVNPTVPPAPSPSPSTTVVPPPPSPSPPPVVVSTTAPVVPTVVSSMEDCTALRDSFPILVPNVNSCCGTERVVCNEVGRITQIKATNMNLSGPIPPTLARLTFLELLWLSNNSLGGAIPPDLGSLSNLRDLSLQSNQLSGKIPSTLGSLSRLLVLNLGRNQLGGTIPESLANLEALNTLRLDGNFLVGGLPRGLNVPNLSYEGNCLTGVPAASSQKTGCEFAATTSTAPPVATATSPNIIDTAGGGAPNSGGMSLAVIGIIIAIPVAAVFFIGIVLACFWRRNLDKAKKASGNRMSGAGLTTASVAGSSVADEDEEEEYGSTVAANKRFSGAGFAPRGETPSMVGVEQKRMSYNRESMIGSGYPQVPPPGSAIGASMNPSGGMYHSLPTVQTSSSLPPQPVGYSSDPSPGSLSARDSYMNPQTLQQGNYFSAPRGSYAPPPSTFFGPGSTLGRPVNPSALPPRSTTPTTQRTLSIASSSASSVPMQGNSNNPAALASRSALAGAAAVHRAAAVSGMAAFGAGDEPPPAFEEDVFQEEIIVPPPRSGSSLSTASTGVDVRGSVISSIDVSSLGGQRDVKKGLHESSNAVTFSVVGGSSSGSSSTTAGVFPEETAAMRDRREALRASGAVVASFDLSGGGRPEKDPGDVRMFPPSTGGGGSGRVENWGLARVSDWLIEIGVPRSVCGTFEDHKIDGRKLLALTDDQLRGQLSISSDQVRATILAAVQRLRGAAGNVSPGGPGGEDGLPAYRTIAHR